MELADCFSRATGAGVPMFRPTATVPTTALHQEASWEKHSIGDPEFLPQVYGEISRRAAVQPHILVQTIQVDCRSDTDRDDDRVQVCAFVWRTCPALQLVCCLDKSMHTHICVYIIDL